MSVSVEHAQLLINSPSTASSAVAGVTKADLQPSGSAIALTSLMALSPANFDIDGQVVALQWQQAGWVISVDAAAVTLAAQQIDGRRGIPVGTGLPTITGSTILFQLSSGDWTLPADSGTPTILGQDIVLEDNRYFVSGAPVLSPSSIVLSENAVVVAASPSFAGQDITLTWGQGTLGVLPATLDIDGQEIALNKTWSLAVDSAAFDVDGQNVIFDWVVPGTVVVDSAQFNAVGSTFTLARHIPITSTAISPTGQSIGRGWGTLVTSVPFEVTPQSVDFQFDYVLGYEVLAAELAFSGKDIVLYLGDGAPTRFRSTLSSNRIQIAFSKPQTFNSSASERIRG